MGFAIGVMRMNLDDFCALSPSQFGECCKAYQEHQEHEVQLKYEVARWMTQIIISPHVKGKPKLALPWDKKPPVVKKADAKAVQSMTMEEALKKMGETL